jgi:hypothetical protein
VTRWDGPPLEAWSHAWTPRDVAAALDGVGVPWCVVGGWSIDLFLGEQTREHEDLEIAVLHRDHLAVRQHLAPLAFCSVGDGEVRTLDPGQPLADGLHQSWGYDVDAQQWRVDVMAEPGDDETWAYRRDPRLTAPRARMIGTSAEGIPYLRPEGSLLFKALPSTKVIRPKDDADFAVCAPRLDGAARAWFAEHLAAFQPDHPWLREISEH